MAPRRLLLVDDDETVLSGLSAILAAHQFQVTTAGGVTEGLRALGTEPFDALVTDLHMPGAGDGLVLAGAMRHINPRAVTVVLSANPDMARACAAIERSADEIMVKPAKGAAIAQAIEARLPSSTGQPRSGPAVMPVDAILERERAVIAKQWQTRMAATFDRAGLPHAEQAEHFGEMLDEILYRLRYPQPLGDMTLFSMAALRHGARRRRQGLDAPALVEEARALQVVLFETVRARFDQIELGQLPAMLMAIADEINAQLLQSLGGYENEKPGHFPSDD